MRLEKWFISNLDDYQRKVIVESIDKNIIVQGSAGSGKTNLAIHRAAKAKSAGGSYAILILTVALKRMIAYGMKALGLDHERIAYEWAWQNRGFDLTGDVYCKQHKKMVTRQIYRNNAVEVVEVETPVVDDANNLYLVVNGNVRKFHHIDRNTPGFETRCKTCYGLDFADWVDDAYYRAWGRRWSHFEEVEIDDDDDFDVANKEYGLIPSGTLYKPREGNIDYLIVDEAQDFNISDYDNKIKPFVGKSLTLLGDSNQKLIRNGSGIEVLRAHFSDYKSFDLYYNYRLPKASAKVAQKIVKNDIDLISTNMKDGGESDFPNYPKPKIKKCQSKEDELKWIIGQIKMEDLDDVAILVPRESDIVFVKDFFAQNGISEIAVHYRTGKVAPFHTISTLDFTNNDLPCVLNYYAAKGTEFDNVFVPFADRGNIESENALYVACTRASHRLFITYSRELTPFLNDVNSDDVVKILGTI